MAKRVVADDLRKWALLVAEQRLAVLATEAAATHRVFPELRGTARGAAAVAVRTARKVAPGGNVDAMSAGPREAPRVAQEALGGREEGVEDMTGVDPDGRPAIRLGLLLVFDRTARDPFMVTVGQPGSRTGG